MPPLPREAENPPHRRTNECPENGGLDDHEHEVPEPLRGVESPDPPKDEQPRPRALGERGEHPAPDREASREVVPSRTIVRFGRS